MENTSPIRVGIDVGSRFLKLVQINGQGKVGLTSYLAHQGHYIRCLREELPKYVDECSLYVGITGVLSSKISEFLGISSIETESSLIHSVSQSAPGVRNIIDIGAAKLTLIRLNSSGKIEGITRNSLCAAGTGSFLDEQAARLGFLYYGPQDVPQIENPPIIATRCAVFAKSDLIHHQQAGKSKLECWVGLCYGMVRTLLNTLLKGCPLEGLTAIVGGVSQNPVILERLKAIYGNQVISLEQGHLAGAYGAALLADSILSSEKLKFLANETKEAGKSSLSTRPSLKLIRSQYPSWEVEEFYKDRYQNEIRVSRTPRGQIVSCYLGIDIGSTSTKLVVIDEMGRIICDVYRKTAGDPIAATQKLFTALLSLSRRRGFTFNVRGCATTGSGRKMVGMIIGADRIINEITCHVTGAMAVDPEIDTIFEIGGQDSKYMRTRNGVIIDAHMNYVCAAGTGSFVEELARKLGYSVDQIGDSVMGISPPHTSDRCTVFMEQDVNRLLHEGYSKEEVLAAVMYSVVQNYLNKVVGNRPYSKLKIFFQGATARNPGLVAAFEKILNVEMVVSPYAHVMGAWGAALLTRGAMEGQERETEFYGLGLSHKKIVLKTERCSQCANNCEIIKARVEGTTTSSSENRQTSWGYLCGRDPQETRVRVNPHYRYFKRRDSLLFNTGRVELPADAARIGIPRCLVNYTFIPLWQRFFAELGFQVVFSPQTNEEIKRLGSEVTSGEFCFPVKAALGHVRWILTRTDVEKIFIPHIISAPPNRFTTNSYFCPYVQSFPSLVRTSLKLNGIDTSKLLTPIIDLRWKEAYQIEEICSSLGEVLKRDRKSITRAWDSGRSAYLEYEDACRIEGEKALQEIEQEERPAILILGRPYNIHDPGVNLGLVRRIAELGHTVIPVDFISNNPSDLGEVFRNMYWNYGQKILLALKRLRTHERIFPIYLTNFNCGPDSFLESYTRRLSGEKPIQVLELDEHEADAGYITRIEAFLDVVKNSSIVPSSFPEIYCPSATNNELKNRTIWIPPMHPAGASFMAAAFRSFGYKAELLPLETEESFEIGRSLTGSECLPLVATIGALVKKLKDIDAQPKEHAYFMATASGPCRFGQYGLKSRLILNESGFNDVPILSPSTLNSYQGLPEKLRRRAWKYTLAADILMKLRCKIRPYASDQSLVLKVFEEEIANLVGAIEQGENFEKLFVRSLSRLGSIDQTGDPKPLVGVVGEIYVRSNAFTNDHVIESIERYGGEAWLAPLSEWFLYTAYFQKWRARQRLGGLVYRGLSNLKNWYFQGVEHRMYRLADPWIHDRHEPGIEDILNAGRTYLPINFEGESILSLGRAIEFIRNGASMVVNCAPFGCMPGSITSALLQKVQNDTGVPVVGIFYDGEKDMNSVLETYLSQIIRSI